MFSSGHSLLVWTVNSQLALNTAVHLVWKPRLCRRTAIAVTLHAVSCCIQRFAWPATAHRFIDGTGHPSPIRLVFRGRMSVAGLEFQGLDEVAMILRRSLDT